MTFIANIDIIRARGYYRAWRASGARARIVQTGPGKYLVAKLSP